MTLLKVANRVTTMATNHGSSVVTVENAFISYDTDISQDLAIPANTKEPDGKVFLINIPLTGLVMFSLGLTQADGDVGEPGPVTVSLQTVQGQGPTTFTNITATATAGVLSSPIITNGGNGYLNGGSGTLALSFIDPYGPGEGTGAAGYVTIVGGVVTAATITNGGVNYSSGTVPTPVASANTFTITLQNGVSWVKGDVIILRNGTTCPVTTEVTHLRIINPNTANMIVNVRAGVCSAGCT